VYERVIAVKHIELGTGKNLCNLLVTAIEECNIVINKCKPSTYLNDISPGQSHEWCYGHVLNLVITDSTCV